MTSTKTRRKLRKITPALRRRIEKTVEQLIEALDHMDAPAEDLEDSHDGEPDQDSEPSLGSLDVPADQARWADGVRLSEYDTDAEEEHDGSEPDEDGEPSLCGVVLPRCHAIYPSDLDKHRTGLSD